MSSIEATQEKMREYEERLFKNHEDLMTDEELGTTDHIGKLVPIKDVATRELKREGPGYFIHDRIDKPVDGNEYKPLMDYTSQPWSEEDWIYLPPQKGNVFNVRIPIHYHVHRAPLESCRWGGYPYVEETTSEGVVHLSEPRLVNVKELPIKRTRYETGIAKVTGCIEFTIDVSELAEESDGILTLLTVTPKHFDPFLFRKYHGDARRLQKRLCRHNGFEQYKFGPPEETIADLFGGNSHG